MPRRVDRSTGAKPPGTRERLLDAAERLFAARGYRQTSIRDITAEAGCNLAAVNYHFGGKLKLYREMFHRRLRELRDRRVESIRRAMAHAEERGGLEAVLREFATAFLEPHLDRSRGQHLLVMFTREMLDPHLPPSMFFKEMLNPLQRTLMEAMVASGVVLAPRDARRCVQSVIAQLSHVLHLRLLSGAAGQRLRKDFALRESVEHIARFSAGGIREQAR
ncbi:MAG: TetR family transcriptional regulator [Acidobacteriota bacterium]